MTNNNHKSTGCGYGEELVSYLYGETENAVFEAHLQDCHACADELEAFSGVHFSIKDWKSKEFDRLATPSIQIPYEKAEKRGEDLVVTGSWLSGLRGLLSLSPAWSLGAASFAVLAVSLGLILFASKSPKQDEVSKTGMQTQKSVTPTENKNVEPANKTPDIVVNPVKEPKAPKPDVVVETNQKDNRVVKTTTNQRQPQNKDNSNTPKNNNVKRDNKNNQVPPGVIEDDEYDNTLRLAEIFDEIDTDE